MHKLISIQVKTKQIFPKVVKKFEHSGYVNNLMLAHYSGLKLNSKNINLKALILQPIKKSKRSRQIAF